MTDETAGWAGDATRRAMVVAAGAFAADCAAPWRSSPPVVQVNLLDQGTPASTDQADAGLLLETALDPSARMTVPVNVNEAGPFTFIVDTGANRSVLASEVAETLQLPVKDQTSVHGIAGVQTAPTVAVRRLRIGGLASGRLAIPVLPRRYLGGEGLLGVDVLADRRITLDYRQRRFTVASSFQADRPGAADATRIAGPAQRDPSVIRVPARQRFGQLTIVDAEIGQGQKLTAFLDSGSQATVGNLALRDAVSRRVPDLARRLVQVQLVSATGQTMLGELAALPILRLGGLRIGNLSCVFADLHTFRIWDLLDSPAILIGVDVLRAFDAVELDFGRRTVAFHTPRP